MNNIIDVIVIGSGLAGMTAAKAVLEENLHVKVITKGEGATIVSSGAIDILGAIPKAAGNDIVTDIKTGIKKLVKEFPNHPYAYLDNYVDNGVKALIEVCTDLKFVGDGIKNGIYPNILGTFKSTAYVPYTSKNAALNDFKGNALVVSFKGYNEFYSEYAAKSYNAYSEKFLGKDDIKYIATTLELCDFKGRTKVTNAELASKLDTKDGVDDLVRLLKEAINMSIGIDLILLPPVLGYEKFNENIDYIKGALNIEVAEILTAGHSVQGQRLVNSMRKGIERHGGEILYSSTVLEVKEACNCFAVKYTQNNKEHVECAKEVIFATGGFIGGGIKSEKEDLYVPLLNIDLNCLQKDKINIKAICDGGQPFLKTGVKYYDDMTLAEGELSGKVYICGEIIEGYDWIYERSGGGVCAASGYLAGKNAAEKAKRGDTL